MYKDKGNRNIPAGCLGMRKGKRERGKFYWGINCIGVYDARAHGEILRVPVDLFKVLCRFYRF